MKLKLLNSFEVIRNRLNVISQVDDNSLFRGMFFSTAKYTVIDKEAKGYLLHITYPRLVVIKYISFYKFKFNISTIDGGTQITGSVRMKGIILLFLSLFFGLWISPIITNGSNNGFLLDLLVPIAWFSIFGGIDYYFFVRNVKSFFESLDKTPLDDIATAFPDVVGRFS